MSLSPTYPVFTRPKYAASLHSTQRAIDAPSIVVRKLGTYITIPAFSIDAIWRGASEIVAKFNFSLSQPISFLHIVEQENFLACVSWKPTEDSIVRYKLWEDVGEIFWNEVYNGQIIGANFAIEIWNINPTASGPSVLELEGGVVEGSLLELEGDHEGSLLELEGGSSLGTIVNITHGGSSILTTSLMTFPTSPYCSLAASDVGGTPPQCTDLIYDLTDFVPFDGDYFVTDGICGETILIKGTRLVIDVFKLQDEDDLTWHNVFMFDLFGEKRLVVDQDPTTPGTDPYFTVKHLTKLTGFKVYLKTLFSEYRIHYFDTGLTTFDYTVLYLSLGGLYYGSRMETVLGEDRLVTSQDGITI